MIAAKWQVLGTQMNLTKTKMLLVISLRIFQKINIQAVSKQMLLVTLLLNFLKMQMGLRQLI